MKKTERIDIVNGMRKKVADATFIYEDDVVVVDTGDQIEWFTLSTDPDIEKTILEFARESTR